ncbi:MAG: cation diffusion facilitator family transporter [Elusimicrobia bacterium]|nr:cation diffusion facilitator family transporter [Candidatus Obscuribacterium magneticum]
MNVNNNRIAVALLSVLSNTTLVVFKIIVGLAIGSVSVISEAIHSGVDLLAAFIALFAVTKSNMPADDDHPFGHGKFENMSGTIEAALIFIAAGWIIYEAIQKLLHPLPIEKANWGVLVMLISSIVNFIVSKMLFKVGKETDSVALEADAWHLRTDVYTSAGVMLALAILWFGEVFIPEYDLQWIDPVAAISVALLIVKAAYELTVKATRDLLDASLPKKEIAWLTEYLVSLVPSVHGFHHLRTRKSGAQRFVDFHILVDEQMSVKNSHQIADDITDHIKSRFPTASVTVHIEPCDGHCSDFCLKGCLLDEQERKKIKT